MGCKYHPKPIPTTSKGSIIGNFECCGQYIINVKNPKSDSEKYVKNQVNNGCEQRRHVHMSPDLNVANSIYKKIGF